MIVKSLDPLYNSLKPSLLFHLTKRGTAKRGLLMRLSREISKPNLYTRDSTGSRWRASSPPLFSILIYSNRRRTFDTNLNTDFYGSRMLLRFLFQTKTYYSIIRDVRYFKIVVSLVRFSFEFQRKTYNVSKSLPSRIGRWRTDDSV